MRRKHTIPLVALFCCTAWAETDIVYHRHLAGDVLSAIEEIKAVPDSRGKNRTEVLAALKERQWPDGVLSVELIPSDTEEGYSTRTLMVADRGLTAGFPAVGKTVFDRKVHQLYALHSLRNVVDVRFGGSLTVDQLVDSAAKRTWEKIVLRVEVLDAGAKGRVLRITSVVDENLVVREQEFLLSERLKKEWGIGHDTENFVYDKREFRVIDDTVEELFKNKEGARVWVVHRRIEPGDENDHGLFSCPLSGGGPIRETLAWGETEAGRVLLVNFIRPHDKRIVQRRVMWRTAPDHIVDMSYQFEKLDEAREVIQIYAKAFPSTIPATLKIDKTGWGRADVALRLKGMQEALSKEPDPFDPLRDRFRRDLGLLNRVLKSPAERAVEGIDERKQQLATLEQWWKENAEKTTWDDESGRLVVNNSDRGEPPEQR